MLAFTHQNWRGFHQQSEDAFIISSIRGILQDESRKSFNDIWGVPQSWRYPSSLDGFCLEKKTIEMDDDWGYPDDETETTIWHLGIAWIAGFENEVPHQSYAFKPCSFTFRLLENVRPEAQNLCWQVQFLHGIQVEKGQDMI